MTEIKIRPTEKKDIEKIEEIIASTPFLHRFNFKSTNSFSAILYNEIVGYISIRKEENDIEIDGIGIAMNWQNKKIGKTLLRFIENMAKDWKIENIYCDVNEENQKALIFFEKNKYRVDMKYPGVKKLKKVV